jgi:prepilin-type N-terminal cleavage/methylation domain-containing protein
MMRPQPKRKVASFTLVELLVVIGIIAILAAVLLTAGNSAIKAALRAKATTMIGQIQIACMSYQNDYAVLPIPSSAVGTQPCYSTGDVQDWTNLICALCGNINPYSGTAATGLTVSNTRSIAYLQLNRSSIDSNGVPVNPISPYSTNTYFNIILDGAYTGVLTNVTGSSSVTFPVFSAGSLSLTGNISGSVYLWANCNSSSGASNVSWWVHAP